MPKRHTDLFGRIASFGELLAASKRAVRGKRRKPGAASFFANLERELLALERQLLDGSYRPGCYVAFEVSDPKKRIVSAVPFRDRVVAPRRSSRRLSPGSSVPHARIAGRGCNMSSSYWTYILASRPRGTLDAGVTNGLIRRIELHRAAFTRKYKVHMLVWFEEFGDVREAIQREKSLKNWPRAWKINLIERTNPHWSDLYPSLPGANLFGGQSPLKPGSRARGPG